MKKTAITLLATLLLTATTFGQEFLVADGSSSGTYAQFLKEITVACTNLSFKEVQSSGAIENLDKLINNEVQGAFMHADVIFFRGQAESLEKFKTLLALFKEDVHFLALTTSKRTSGGTLGWGAKPVVLNNITDLNGLKVGAAGGGFITAQVVRLQSQIGYQVVQYPGGKEALAALGSGEVDCVIFVGASPLPNLKDLGKDYKLLSVPDATMDKLKNVYKPTHITYTKMSADAVSTISVQCLFVTKEYKTPRMVESLRTFRNSFYANLDALKETPGNHRKWQEVDPDEHGPWPWLELGTNAPAK